jgi:dienelactone hydrolase
MPNQLPRSLTLAMLAFWITQPARSAEDKSQASQAETKKSAAPYAIDHDKPLEGKEEVVAEADGYTQYRVEFNGSKGDRVPGFLYVPKRKGEKASARLPAVLLQYGTGGNKTTNYIVAIGKQFVARGFVVLTIDSPGRGERKKEKEKKASLGLLNTDEFMQYCADYSRAIDFLTARPEVDRERVGYVGISWGAITGITYVAYDPRIRAMASLVGGGDFFGAYTPEVAEKAAREVMRVSDPVYHVARIAPRPLLFINVKKDQLILRPWAESLHKAAGAGSKVVWLDADHYFKGVDRAAVCDSVIDFMEKELAGKRPADGK